MLHSLEIKNYRNLRHLVIPKLGRVNLVIGKNNTGKSSLLEAVAISRSNHILNTLTGILASRGEEINLNDIERDSKVEKVYSSLFYNSNVSYWDYESAIKLSSKVDDYSLMIRIGYMLGDSRTGFSVATNEEDLIKYPSREKIIIFEGKKDRRTYSLTTNNILRNHSLNEIATDEYKYIGPSLSTVINSFLWDIISLTSYKQQVINALGIIEPKILDLDFNSNGEVFILHDELGKLPLKRMGDGINRILTIILKMVTCENGCLLIDEFENGLHYSVQEKLWDIIFQLADKLNIQIFATTHSDDTIKAFESIMNSNESYKDSQLIKLINIDGDIKQETADAEDLEIIVDGNIDPR
ncbi:ATP/GTP-binding protein [Siphonobacter sp. SORGH_AS_1065]|uniref:AAA family ATPase n=1 Tax=Siphonobacter sp. SORGH_AS_1065 TaxID=3041795 RepID=UPI0027881FBB|nr:AAA family ATPase [Siphonobacter sp. SORGH_AS_1065]MDQ1088088.1 AAA15 family ATPase/GTPase [Siphonobacter sp. SORGH_AS_1065]